MNISDFLEKKNNNLDLFRLIASCFVIYGHAYAISPQEGKSDFIGRMLEFDYSGSLAVKIFFFLSGLVVTNSLLNKKNVANFFIARIFRIWPGLIFVTLICTFLLGPIVTNISPSEYFKNPIIYKYIIDNAMLSTAYELPGVFNNHPHPNAVNGSLWTLPYEFCAYISLAALYLIGIFKFRFLFLFISILILIDPITGNKIIFNWRPPLHEIDFLFPCFSMGAIIAYFKKYLHLRIDSIAGLIILTILLRHSLYFPYIFYACIFWSMLYIASQPWMLRLRPSVDVSYGVYLWGFPIQQFFYYLFPHGSVAFNQFTSLILSLMMGYISWYLVEKPGIAIGKRIMTGKSSANISQV